MRLRHDCHWTGNKAATCLFQPQPIPGAMAIEWQAGESGEFATWVFEIVGELAFSQNPVVDEHIKNTVVEGSSGIRLKETAIRSVCIRKPEREKVAHVGVDKRSGKLLTVVLRTKNQCSNAARAVHSFIRVRGGDPAVLKNPTALDIVHLAEMGYYDDYHEKFADTPPVLNAPVMPLLLDPPVDDTNLQLTEHGLPTNQRASTGQSADPVGTDRSSPTSQLRLWRTDGSRCRWTGAYAISSSGVAAQSG